MIILLLIASVIQLVFFTRNNIYHFNKNKKAEQKALEDSKEKTNFLNTMSHEIRTPLNAINGLSYILKTENPEKHQVNYIDSLLYFGKNLMTLLNNVLDYSKYQSEKLVLDSKPNNIVETIKKEALNYQKECENKGLIFKLDIDDTIPNVEIDSKKFGSVVDNLVLNAIKFTHNGNVSLSVKNISKKKDNVVLTITVKDTGEGLSKNKQEIILDKKNDIYGITQNKDQKIGLGIPIVKSILHLMNSELNIKSKPRLGSSFYFTLNLNKAALTKEVEIHEINNNNLKLYGKRVLLVDDNKINILVAKKCLEKEKLVITEANNGLEAVEKMQQQYFDIVLMDIQMPILNGFEATKKIRTFNKNTPIFALSASVLQDVKEDLHTYGLNGLILKPFNPEELINTLKKHIGYE
ncbi:MAG: response regulator [Polaribacter sp.]